MLQGLIADDVHVHPEGLRVHPVGGDLVEPAGEIDLHPVGEVAAVGQLQAEDPVAGVDQRVHGRRVGLRTRVWLHVGVLGSVQGLHPGAGQLLGDVDELAAAVVPLARVTLRVLVRQHAALGLQHRPGGEVLAGDHLQGVALAAELVRQNGGQLGVDLGQRAGGDLHRRRGRRGGRYGFGHGRLCGHGGLRGRGKGLVEHRRSSGGGTRSLGRLLVRPPAAPSGPGVRPEGETTRRFPVVIHPNASRGAVSLPIPSRPMTDVEREFHMMASVRPAARPASCPAGRADHSHVQQWCSDIGSFVMHVIY